MATQLIADDLLDRVAQRFRMLSDPIRLKLLNQLVTNGEMCVKELVEATRQQQANISKHLAMLAREGILRRRKEGLKVFYGVEDPSIHGLCLMVCGRLREEAAAQTEVLQNLSNKVNESS